MEHLPRGVLIALLPHYRVVELGLLAGLQKVQLAQRVLEAHLYSPGVSEEGCQKQLCSFLDLCNHPARAVSEAEGLQIGVEFQPQSHQVSDVEQHPSSVSSK
jgi:hypothetical protein